MSRRAAATNRQHKPETTGSARARCLLHACIIGCTDMCWQRRCCMHAPCMPPSAVWRCVLAGIVCWLAPTCTRFDHNSLLVGRNSHDIRVHSLIESVYLTDNLMASAADACPAAATLCSIRSWQGLLHQTGQFLCPPCVQSCCARVSTVTRVNPCVTAAGAHHGAGSQGDDGAGGGHPEAAGAHPRHCRRAAGDLTAPRLEAVPVSASGYTPAILRLSSLRFRIWAVHWSLVRVLPYSPEQNVLS